jgi:hypothetical protein
MKAHVGIGWIILALFLSSMAYGWKGCLWTFVALFAYGFIVWPLIAIRAAKVKLQAAKEMDNT